MNQQELGKYEIGSKVNLNGYTSSTLDINTAYDFALGEIELNDQSITRSIPVVFEIKFTGSKGLFLLSEGYTAFPEEDEILIQDGYSYRIVSKTLCTRDGLKMDDKNN